MINVYEFKKRNATALYRRKIRQGFMPYSGPTHASPRVHHTRDPCEGLIVWVPIDWRYPGLPAHYIAERVIEYMGGKNVSIQTVKSLVKRAYLEFLMVRILAKW